MPRLPWTRPKASQDDAEADLTARYEPIQRHACETANAPFVAPDYSKLVWLGPSIAEGNRLVDGGRYAETSGWSGWSLIAADQPKPAPTEIRFEHLSHIVSIREDLMPYLGLPVGWTFEVFSDGSWHAWSPKDRLLTLIASFLAGTDTTPGDATAIAELIAEQFGGTDLRARTEGPLLAYANGSGISDEALREALASGLDWLRASPIR